MFRLRCPAHLAAPLLAALSLALGPRPAFTQTDDAQLLEPGQTVTREAPPGELFHFRLRLKAQDYLRLEIVGSYGARLTGPDGATVESAQAPSQRVVAVAPTDGEYRLTITPGNPVRKNKLQITLGEPRPVTEENRRQYRAYQLYHLITALYEKQTAEALREGLAVCAEALALLEGANDLSCEAYVLYYRGFFHSDLGEPELAMADYEEARWRYRMVGDQKFEAIATHCLANAHSAVSEHQQAIGYLTQILPIHLAAEDTSSSGWTYLDLAANYSALGEKRKALEYLHLALAQYRREGAGREFHRGQGHVFTRMAQVHSSLGEKQQALDCLARALEHYRAAPDEWATPSVFHQYGAVYESLGEQERALESYRRALALWEQFSNPRGKAATLGSLGALALSAGENAQALDHFNEALKLVRAISDRRGQAYALSNLGRAAALAGRDRDAVEYFSQALTIYRETGDRAGEAQTLALSGAAQLKLNELTAARESLRQALALHQAVLSREGEAATLYHLARAERAAGDIGAAKASIAQAVELTEFVRSSVLSQELRATYAAAVRDYYELYIDLLMQLPRTPPGPASDGPQPLALPPIAAALHINEWAQARSLIELLAESRADIREGVTPELAARERELQQRLSAKAEYQTRLLSRKHSPELAAAAAREVAALIAEVEKVKADIRANSPRYASITQPRPLTAPEIQQQVLDRETVLLEYALGAERSYLWAVTPTSLNSYELPPRAEIERAARRVYELLTARSRAVKGETSEQRRARVRQADAGYPAAAAELSRMLLAPAAPLLDGKRLLIVPQGALQFIPFGALPAPESETKGNLKERRQRDRTPRPFTPLIVNHEIVTIPSASTLALLRRDAANRQPGPKTIAVLADPVFSADDERVLSANAQAVKNNSPVPQGHAALREVLRSLADIAGEGRENGLALARLYGTRWEADQIAALVPEAERLKALDFAASRATATSAELSQYRILHFASHALINDAHPELSGLVLSLVDEQGRAQDGFLRAHELYNLKLPAELVVLSACQTGLGKEVKGEGMVGLTQGFMYAGAPRVLVSLWPLDDRATARLMTGFYKRLLGPEKLSPAAALRAAQVEMWQAGWPSPYHWAAFTLQGDWR
jgi:CHAT domain-containing protein/tetratricopeptide (TPR) repeat protein